MLDECDELYLTVKEDAVYLYDAFTMISILSIMNFSFVVEHIITYLVTKKLDRFYTMPQILHFTDSFLAICSCMILKWYRETIQRDLYTDPNISDAEFEQRIFANFADNIDFKFQYLFSVSVSCLIFRIARCFSIPRVLDHS